MPAQSNSATESLSSLPVIDFEGFREDRRVEEEVARRIDDAFRTIGFCYFKNIGIPQALLDRLFEISHRFHALPLDQKLAIRINRFHRGYMASETEKLETSTVALATRPSFSESYMFMHEIDAGDSRHGRLVHGPNQWPAALPEFRTVVLDYQAAMEEFNRRLLRTLAIALDLPVDWFRPYFERAITFLRLIHYPPRPQDYPSDAFGLAPHTDYGFITILAQDDVSGLEVRRRGATEWMVAPPLPGTFVVNVADLLAHWTNGRWQSTPHRAKNVPGAHRYSCPYFFDMDGEAVIDCVPSCVGTKSERRAAPTRYDDVLEKHLSSNYDYRKTDA